MENVLISIVQTRTTGTIRQLNSIVVYNNIIILGQNGLMQFIINGFVICEKNYHSVTNTLLPYRLVRYRQTILYIT